MLVENRIENVNAFFLTKYNKLTESSNFTFSMKIRLLESFNFIPHKIIVASNCLREIRNEFAHSLEKQDFSQIKQGTLEKLRQISHQVYQYAGETTDDRNDLLKSFKKLSFFCITGLHSYAGNIKLLREEISKKDFIAGLEQVSHKYLEDHHAFIEEVTKGNPIRVEVKGEHIHKTFEGGVVKVIPIEEYDSE